MPPFQTPEMQRLPLQELCLRIKAYGYGAVEEFLLKAMDPPQKESIQMAMQQLVEVKEQTNNNIILKVIFTKLSI
jgi:ATP-dependent RNA helicase DHX29